MRARQRVERRRGHQLLDKSTVSLACSPIARDLVDPLVDALKVLVVEHFSLVLARRESEKRQQQQRARRRSESSAAVEAGPQYGVFASANEQSSPRRTNLRKSHPC